LLSTLCSLSDTQQRTIESAISGPLKQELTTALTTLQKSSSPLDPSLQHLHNYLFKSHPSHRDKELRSTENNETNDTSGEK
jgi:hypothetical protein